MGRQILIIAMTSVILTQIATFTTSIYLHRVLSHRSLVLRSGRLHDEEPALGPARVAEAIEWGR